MNKTVSRNRAIVLNRVTISAAVSMALASYFWQPTRLVEYALDIVLRAYLHFIAGSMAHESAHGHLGKSKSVNLWWGRIALVPSTTPFVTFRKAHMYHHAATNVPDKDPDAFLNTRSSWQLPFRALLLPSHWLLWLWKRDRLTRRDMVEFTATCLAEIAIYGTIAHFVGIERVLAGLIPSAVLHSLVLWYCFAVKTHEGYSTGAPETRSHNYYGRILFKLTFGLSMHRAHHLQPSLAWLQMADQVPSGTWRQSLGLARDIRAHQISRTTVY